MNNLKETKYKRSYWGLNPERSSPESQDLPLGYKLFLTNLCLSLIINLRIDNLKETKYKTSYWGLNPGRSSPESKALPLGYKLLLKLYVWV